MSLKEFMTISSATSKNQYTANGSNTIFAYSFKIFDDDDIRVLVDDEVQAKTTDYSVSGVGVSTGGNITFTTAPTAGAIVTIKRNEPLTQEIDYVDGDDFPAAAHEEGLDRSVIRDQYLQEQLDRSIKFSEGSDVSGISTSLEIADLKGKLLGFNSTTGQPQGVTNDGSANSVTSTGATVSRLLADRFADIIYLADYGLTGNGSTDDTTKFQLALDNAENKILLCEAEKSYAVSQITLPEGITIIWNNCTLVATGSLSEASSLLVAQESNIKTIGKLRINMGAQTRRSGAIGSASADIYNISLDDIEVEYSSLYVPTSPTLNYSIRITRCIDSFFNRIDILNSERSLWIRNCTSSKFYLGDFTGYINAVRITDYKRLIVECLGTISTPSINASVTAGYNGMLISSEGSETPDGLVLKYPKILDAGEHGIRFAGEANAYNITIEKPYIKGSGGSNIKLLSGADAYKFYNVVIDSPCLVDALQSGSKLSCGIIAYRCRGLKILNPEIKKEDHTSSGEHGISLFDVQNFEISNVDIRDALEDGISVRTSHNSADDSESGSSLLYRNIVNGRISGKIQDCGSDGIDASYEQITIQDVAIDCLIANCSGRAMRLTKSTTGTITNVTAKLQTNNNSLGDVSNDADDFYYIVNEGLSQDFTPILIGSSVAGDHTYSVQEGTWTDIGGKIHIEGRLALSDKGTIAGNIRLGGMPKNIKSSSIAPAIQIMGVGRASNITLTNGFITLGNFSTSESYFAMYDGATATAITDAALTDTSQIRFSFIYTPVN
jgi:hypothetical protein